jgi:hypothetical protein
MNRGNGRGTQDSRRYAPRILADIARPVKRIGRRPRGERRQGPAGRRRDTECQDAINDDCKHRAAISCSVRARHKQHSPRPSQGKVATCGNPLEFAAWMPESLGKPSSMVLLWGGIGIGGIAVMLVIDMLVARAL